MKVQLQINYSNFLVEQDDIPTLLEIFTRSTTGEGKFIPVSVSEAPDLTRNLLKEELKKELGDETAKYSKYWLDERAVSEKLRKELSVLKGE